MFYQKRKGLFFFNIPPKELNQADYLVNFKLFYKDICNLEVLSAEDLDFMKTKSKDIALSFYRTYNKNVPQHLSKGEFDALKDLSRNKHIVIQKSDKGNSIVTFYRDECLKGELSKNIKTVNLLLMR